MSTTKVLTGLSDIQVNTTKVLTGLANIAYAIKNQTRECDFYAKQGTTFYINLPVYNSDGTAFNLTGWTVNGWMNQTYNNIGIDIPISLTLSVVGAPTNGTINWTITNVNTLAMTPGEYFYNIDIVQDGIEFRILEGVWTLRPVHPLITITSTQTLTGLALISSS